MAIASIIRDIGDRVRVEQKLLKSEERFRQVFEHAPFGLCATALNGSILQVNPALCRMLGYTEAELLGAHWASFTHPEDLAPFQLHLKEWLREPDGPLELEKRYIHRGGNTVWGRVTISLVRDREANPSYLVIHVEDITERKRVEEALRESEERFRIMADGCPAALWVTDATGGNQFVNLAYRGLFGITYEEVDGDRWQALIHPEDAPTYTEAFQQAVREHRPFRAEARVRRANGDWRWVSSYGEPRFAPSGEYLGHVGLSPDITESRQAEQAREYQHSLLRAINDVTPDGILVVNDENQIVSNNKRFLDIWQLPMDAGSGDDRPILRACARQEP